MSRSDEQVSQSREQMKEWLGLLDDKERAEVLKVQIAEEAATERKRIEEQGQTDRDDDVVSGRYVVRGIWAFVVLIAVACATCVSHRLVEGRYPDRGPPAPVSPAASASPR